MGRLIHVEINFLQQVRCTAIRAGMPICRGRDGGVRYGSGIINSDDVSIINWREQAREGGREGGREGQSIPRCRRARAGAGARSPAHSAAKAKIEPISHLNLRPPPPPHEMERERRALSYKARLSCGRRVRLVANDAAGSIFHYFHSESSFERVE